VERDSNQRGFLFHTKGRQEEEAGFLGLAVLLLG